MCPLPNAAGLQFVHLENGSPLAPGLEDSVNQLGLIVVWSSSALAAWFRLNSVGVAGGPGPCAWSLTATGQQGQTGLEKRGFSKVELARHVSRWKCGRGLLCGSI